MVFDTESLLYCLDVNADGVLDVRLIPPEDGTNAGVVPLPGIAALKPSYTVDLSDKHRQYGQVTFVFDPAFGTSDFTLPANISAIEESAFEGIAATIVDIPEDCLSIGDYAFKDCLSLTQIRIPVGCELGDDVFDGCTLVYVFGVASSPAEDYCDAHENCVFVAEE